MIVLFKIIGKINLEQFFEKLNFVVIPPVEYEYECKINVRVPKEM